MPGRMGCKNATNFSVKVDIDSSPYPVVEVFVIGVSYKPCLQCSLCERTSAWA